VQFRGSKLKKECRDGPEGLDIAEKREIPLLLQSVLLQQQGLKEGVCQ